MDKMDNTYDAVIIGGGHNGLIAAAYLAKSGRRVLVLEKKDIIGGVAVTEEFFPGFKASSLVDASDAFSPRVRADLDLARFGPDVLPADPLVFAPQKDGKHLVIHHDINLTARGIAGFSRADADAYPAFIKEMRKIAPVISGLNHMTLPDMPDVGLRDVGEMLKLFKPIRKLGWKNIAGVMRIMPLSVCDLLSEWFESDVVKGAIAGSALNNISLGPRESGTAYAFLQNFSNSNNGLFRSGGLMKGGMGALTTALADAAKGFGAKILTDTEVSRITIQNKRATGVVLAGGKIIPATVVVSATDMRTTFLKMIEPGDLDHSVISRVQNITCNGTMARVHFALNALPAFKGLTGNPQEMLGGHIQIMPTLTDLQKAFDPVKYGQFTENPCLDIRIPSLTDASLAPKGGHVMSVTVKYMPYHLRDGNWKDLSDSLGQRVLNIITDYAPGFSQCVQHCHVITPLDMETRYHLPEGSLTHGDVSLHQSLWMRPIPGYTQYRSPVKGLYLCSAATHPGAGVSGINGLNAAGRILKDRNK